MALRGIIEKRIEKNKQTYIAFIDAEKAFDRVNWRKMFEILKEIGIEEKERRIIYNIYKDQTAVLEYEGEKEEARIRQGVRQGCPLSPMLFNLYTQKAIDELRIESNTGIKIHGNIIDAIRYADDIALLAESEEQLTQSMRDMDKLFREEYNIKINKKKTKVMVCGKTEQNINNINIDNESIKEVNEFKYLGSIITKDGRSRREINNRINLAKRAFYNKKQLLTSNNITIKTRKQFIQTYIWSTALYGCETWTVSKSDRRKLEAFEMWCYRRALKVSWMERKTNEEVLALMGEERKIWKQIKKRRDQMIGHVLRREGLLKTIIEGKIEGKNPRGRPRLSYIKQIIEDTGSTNYQEMKRKSANREEWIAATNQSED